MFNRTALLVSTLTLALAFGVLAVSAHACAGCGGSSGGAGSVSGGYPTFNYDFKYNIQFQSCRGAGPGGTLHVSYDNGLHWIVGSSTLREGSDYVYSKGNDDYVQCYCPVGAKNTFDNINNGTQTNWIKVSNLSKEQTGYLLRNGWVWVQNGGDFGLKSEPYLAQNLPFACGQIACNTITPAKPMPTLNPTRFPAYMIPR